MKNIQKYSEHFNAVFSIVDPKKSVASPHHEKKK